MLARLWARLLAALVFLAGRRSGEATAAAQQAAVDAAAVARSAGAANTAPADRGALARELRDGEF